MQPVDQQLNRTGQYAAYFALAFLALVFAVLLQYLPGAYFTKFFGDANPLVVFIVLPAVGAAALWSL